MGLYLVCIVGKNRADGLEIVDGARDVRIAFEPSVEEVDVVTSGDQFVSNGFKFSGVDCGRKWSVSVLLANQDLETRTPEID